MLANLVKDKGLVKDSAIFFNNSLIAKSFLLYLLIYYLGKKVFYI